MTTEEPGPPGLERSRASRRTAAVAAAVALVAFLPFAPGLLSGQSFFFRDLSRQFFPWRQFAVDGLLRGEVRYWNPYAHEGEPLHLLAISYPVDLLQVFWPDEWGFSLLLALHVPFAALAFMALARGLGLSLAAAAGGSLVYALGGFGLSCLSLYDFLHAVAWAPLVVLGLLRAAEGGRRRCATGALVTAVAISTMGVEITGQAMIVGIVLAMRAGDPPRWGRLAVTLALAFGLAGVPLFVTADMLAESARAKGFTTEHALAFSVHPVTLLQVVIGSLYGDPSSLVDRFWGKNFTPNFPYIMSLYLGAAALSIAGVGARFGTVRRGRILLLAIVATAICLGHWVGLDRLVEAFPGLRAFRSPVKAFFTVHLAAALLAAQGFQALAPSGNRRPWRLLAGLGLASAGALASLPLLARAAPGATRRLIAWFFPPALADVTRIEASAAILRDAAIGALPALAIAVVALLVLRRRLPSLPAVALAAGLIGADLLRTGAGLNPTVPVSFFELSPEMSRVATRLRAAGGRTFTCEPEFSLTFHRAALSLAHGRQLWAVATNIESMIAFHTMRVGVPTAYSRDVTMAVPLRRVFERLEDVACADMSAIVDRLRRAGVSHILSLAPQDDPGLRPFALVAPRRIAPLSVYVYELRPALPSRAVARTVRLASDAADAEALAAQPGFQEQGGVAVEGIAGPMASAGGSVTALSERSDRIELAVEAEDPTVVVIRDAYAPGWTASLDGMPARLLRADGRHRAVAVPTGRSRVVLEYRPPSLSKGLLVTLLSAVALALLWRSQGRRERRQDDNPSATDYTPAR